MPIEVKGNVREIGYGGRGIIRRIGGVKETILGEGKAYQLADYWGITVTLVDCNESCCLGYLVGGREVAYARIEVDDEPSPIVSGFAQGLLRVTNSQHPELYIEAQYHK